MDELIYLASRSPRRRELLQLTGLEFEILPLEIQDEKALLEGFSGDIVEQAECIALAKIRLALDSNLPGIFIAADTIVVSEDGVVLGKPANKLEVGLYLDRLSGNWHTVATGVALARRQKSESLGGTEHIESVLVTTRVKFSPMTRTEIREYIATGEPFDKAGGYGIQGRASIFIEKIDGCYFNVVGFPLNAFWNLWKNFNKINDDSGVSASRS